MPEELLRDLEMIEDAEHTDRSTAIMKLCHNAIGESKLEHYARLYGEGEPTRARAARNAGVSMWEMMHYARQNKIAAQYDLEDFERDVKSVRVRLASRLEIYKVSTFCISAPGVFMKKVPVS